jgi:hypothetical protein
MHHKSVCIIIDAAVQGHVFVFDIGAIYLDGRRRAHGACYINQRFFSWNCYDVRVVLGSLILTLTFQFVYGDEINLT